MLGNWYSEFVHIHVFMGIHETINNNQKDLNTTFVLNCILLTIRTQHTNASNLRLVLQLLRIATFKCKSARGDGGGSPLKV